MAAFATTTELAVWLRDPTVGDTASAELVLAVASAAIRNFCGWDISETTVTGDALDGTGERSIWLPTLRLTAVSAVVENGRALTVVTDYDWTRYGKLIRAGRWTRAARSVVVTYTHGYAVVPEVVKGACLIVAAVMHSNPEFQASKSETMGPFAESVSYPTTSPASSGKTGLSGGLPAAVMEMLAPFKLEHVG